MVHALSLWFRRAAVPGRQRPRRRRSSLASSDDAAVAEDTLEPLPSFPDRVNLSRTRGASPVPSFLNDPLASFLDESPFEPVFEPRTDASASLLGGGLLGPDTLPDAGLLAPMEGTSTNAAGLVPPSLAHIPPSLGPLGSAAASFGLPAGLAFQLPFPFGVPMPPSVLNSGATLLGPPVPSLSPFAPDSQTNRTIPDAGLTNSSGSGVLANQASPPVAPATAAAALRSRDFELFPVTPGLLPLPPLVPPPLFSTEPFSWTPPPFSLASGGTEPRPEELVGRVRSAVAAVVGETPLAEPATETRTTALSPPRVFPPAVAPVRSRWESLGDLGSAWPNIDIPSPSLDELRASPRLDSPIPAEILRLLEVPSPVPRPVPGAAVVIDLTDDTPDDAVTATATVSVPMEEEQSPTAPASPHRRSVRESSEAADSRRREVRRRREEIVARRQSHRAGRTLEPPAALIVPEPPPEMLARPSTLGRVMESLMASISAADLSMGAFRKSWAPPREPDATMVEEPTDISKEANTCKICLVNGANAIALPCAHIACCIVCLVKVKNSSGCCPVCRSRIGEAKRIFRA